MWKCAHYQPCHSTPGDLHSVENKCRPHMWKQFPIPWLALVNSEPNISRIYTPQLQSCVSLLHSTPMKMEWIASSEKSAPKAQTPGDYPKGTIRQQVLSLCTKEVTVAQCHLLWSSYIHEWDTVLEVTALTSCTYGCPKRNPYAFILCIYFVVHTDVEITAKCITCPILIV